MIVDGKGYKGMYSDGVKDGRKEDSYGGRIKPAGKGRIWPCFYKAGAVQCGFCILGMVMCAKALLDVNPAPDRLEVIAAIRNNVCRCTGYKKIIEAILLSALILREGLPVEEEQGKVPVEWPCRGIDAREKVLGTGEYLTTSIWMA